MDWMFVLPLALFAISCLAILVRVKSRFSASVVATTGLVEFARELGSMTSEHLTVNWSGQPEDLHRALKPLLEKARALALQRGITMDEDTLRSIVFQAVARTKLVKRTDLAAAIDSIERPTHRAA